MLEHEYEVANGLGLAGWDKERNELLGQCAWLGSTIQFSNGFGPAHVEWEPIHVETCRFGPDLKIAGCTEYGIEYVLHAMGYFSLDCNYIHPMIIDTRSLKPFNL